MKRITIFLSALFVLTAFTVVNNTWKNDPPHSQLGFTVTHLGINDISGFFHDFDVSIHSSKADFSDAVFELKAKTASIDTRVEARNNHLKSADFFDAEKYPEIYFKSTSITPAEKNHFKLKGNLTMHGITKEVVMDLEHRATIENPMSKKPTAGFRLTGTLKRSDFKIGTGFPDAVISDEVKIKADGEFAQ